MATQNSFQPNNFRYGEISRLNAGNFLSEAYSQGCFEFTNMRSLYAGGCMRRPPLRLMASSGGEESEGKPLGTEGLVRIVAMPISETLCYLVGFTVHEIRLYAMIGGTLTCTATAAWPMGNGIATEEGGEVPYVPRETIVSMCTALYYNRMYVASSSFRTIAIDVSTTGDTFQAYFISIVTNGDAKKRLWITPSPVFDEEGNRQLELEGRPVFMDMPQDGDGEAQMRFYLDAALTEEYRFAEKYPPAEASSKWIFGFDDYTETSLMSSDLDYPSVVAVLYDSLWLANTIREPSKIWKSRTMGSSQFITDRSSDSLHDFVGFQIATSATSQLKDTDDWPMTEAVDAAGNVIYEVDDQMNLKWYAPTKDEDGNWTYERQLWRKKDDAESETIWEWYLDSLCSQKADTSSWGGESPLQQDGKWYAPNKDEAGNYKKDTQVWRKAAGANPGAWHWFYDPEFREAADMSGWNGETPVNKPQMVIDTSRFDEMIERVTQTQFVVTDSCGCELELNTSRNDAVTFISTGCGYIIIGTTTGEHTLPTGFTAVDNFHAEQRGWEGSQKVQPVTINSSFIFAQRNNVLRELYMNEGYMEKSDITALNHEIVDGRILTMQAKNTPNCDLYVLMEDGTIVYCDFDKEHGICSLSRWEFDERIRVLSIAIMDIAGSVRAVCLCDMEGTEVIAELDEGSSDFRDLVRREGDDGEELWYPFESRVESVYTEIVDQSLAFGSFKGADVAWLRCSDTGRIYMGNDVEQLKLTDTIGSDDCRMVLTGDRRRRNSVKVRSYGGEPMTILCMSWEERSG